MSFPKKRHDFISVFGAEKTKTIDPQATYLHQFLQV